MAHITREQVQHLAHLARLELTDEETAHYTDQLSAIVEAVERVSEVAADDIPPTSHPVPMTNVFREDVARQVWTVRMCRPERPRGKTTASAFRAFWMRTDMSVTSKPIWFGKMPPR